MLINKQVYAWNDYCAIDNEIDMYRPNHKPHIIRD